MNRLSVLLIAIMVIGIGTGCDSIMDQIKDMVGTMDVDAEVNLFYGNYAQDSFQMDLLSIPTDFVSSDPDDIDAKQTIYADYRAAFSLPALGSLATQLQQISQLEGLMDDPTFEDLHFEGSVDNFGNSKATFELRVANKSAIQTVQELLDSSAPLAEISIEAGSSLDLSRLDEMTSEVAGNFADWMEAFPPQDATIYFLYLIAHSTDELDVSVSQFVVTGAGYRQQSLEIESNNLSDYKENIEEVKNVKLVGSIANNNLDDSVTVIVAANYQKEEDNQPSIFEDETRWLIYVELGPGERTEINSNPHVLTEYSSELMDWMVTKMIKGGTIQSDMGVWCESDVDVFMDIKVDVSLEVGL